MIKKVVSAILLTAVAFTAAAENVLDLGATRINSDSTTATLSIKSRFHGSVIEPRFEIDYIYQSQNGDMIKDRLDFLAAADRPVSDRFYLQGALRYEHDDLRQHREKYVATAGLGVRVIESDSLTVNYEIAPGYQFYEPQDTAMVRNSIAARYQFSSGVAVSNNTTIESGGNDTYVRNITEVSTRISDNLSLVFDHTYRRETETDNITGIKLRIAF